MDERESLAWQCLVIRDYFLMLELYGTCLRAARGQPNELPPAPNQRVEEKTVAERTPVPANEKVLPFSEWLFNPST